MDSEIESRFNFIRPMNMPQIEFRKRFKKIQRIWKSLSPFESARRLRNIRWHDVFLLQLNASDNRKVDNKSVINDGPQRRCVRACRDLRSISGAFWRKISVQICPFSQLNLCVWLSDHRRVMCAKKNFSRSGKMTQLNCKTESKFSHLAH
jgi:hypothetical protein